MENVVHRLTLDLTKPDVFPRVEVQRDNARTLVVSLSQNGRPYWIAEGVTAVFSARKPDGKPLFNACTVEKNTVRYDFTDQTTNVPGIVECEILLYSGDERILASPRFELAVDDLIHQEGDVPESAPEVTALTQMLATGTDMLEDLGELEEVLEQAERSASLASKMASGAIAAQEAALSAASDAESAKKAALTAKVKAEDSAGLAAASADTASSKAQESAVSADRAQQLADGASAAAQAASSSAGRAEAAAKALESFEETDPTVPEWAKQPQKPTYTAQEVGADPAGTAAYLVTDHGTLLTAHADIRNAVETLRRRLSALADSDDTTLDQLSEIVSYIKSNKSLIDAITTSKVSVADIVDNLVTNVANKPLSAAQGVALKALVDGLDRVVNRKEELPITALEGYIIYGWGELGAGASHEQVSEPITVKAGQQLLVTGSARYQNLIWAIYDSAGRVLLYEMSSDAGYEIQAKPVTVPAGAVSMRVAWDAEFSRNRGSVVRVIGQEPAGAVADHNASETAHADIREKLDFDSGDDGHLLMVNGGRAAPLPIGAGLEVRDGRLGVSGVVNLYVCSDGEYTPGGAPVIAEPDESTFYLVPQDSEGTLYASWVYADGAWEFVETLTVTFDEAEDGAPGYTPVKGVDYYTDADKAELVQSVLAALPTWTGGAY